MLEYSQLNARIMCEMEAIVNLGVDIGAAKARVGLEVDVPEGADLEDVENALMDDIEEWLEEAIEDAITVVIEKRMETVNGK